MYHNHNVRCNGQALMCSYVVSDVHLVGNMGLVVLTMQLHPTSGPIITASMHAMAARNSVPIMQADCTMDNY